MVSASASRKRTDSDSRAEAKKKNVFVTVGTTSFDALIQALDDVTVIDILRSKGYASLTLQIGRGTYTPRNIVPPGRSRAVLAGSSGDASEPREFVVECFDFRPSLDEAMREADLVVCHAGAGSVFEALGLRRPLLVVVNETLMDNHQVELAEELAGRGHLRWCVPEGVGQALRDFRPDGEGGARVVRAPTASFFFTHGTAPRPQHTPPASPHLPSTSTRPNLKRKACEDEPSTPQALLPRPGFIHFLVLIPDTRGHSFISQLANLFFASSPHRGCLLCVLCAQG